MKTSLTVIGIDPGLLGGIGVVTDGQIIRAIDAPEDLADRWANVGAEIEVIDHAVCVVIEKPPLMIAPQRAAVLGKDGRVTNKMRAVTNIKPLTSIHRQYGEYRMMARFYLPEKNILEPGPQEWQKFFHGMPGDNAKTRVQAYLKRFHADAYQRFCVGKRGGYLDGPGDALGLALYGYHRLSTQVTISQQKAG